MKVGLFALTLIVLTISQSVSAYYYYPQYSYPNYGYYDSYQYYGYPMYYGNSGHAMYGYSPSLPQAGESSQSHDEHEDEWMDSSPWHKYWAYYGIKQEKNNQLWAKPMPTYRDIEESTPYGSYGAHNEDWSMFYGDSSVEDFENSDSHAGHNH